MSLPIAHRLPAEPVALRSTPNPGIPWKTLVKGAGAKGLSGLRGLSASDNSSAFSSGYVFFTVSDARADKARLGQFLSSSAEAHRNLLAEALKRAEGVDIAEVKKHLLMLCAANQRCSNARAPTALHLYMGLGHVPASDAKSAAKLLLELCQVASAIVDALNDRAAENMLHWVRQAWLAHATLLEEEASSETRSFFRPSHARPELQAVDASVTLRTSAGPRGPQDSGIPWKGDTSGTSQESLQVSVGDSLFFSVQHRTALEAGLGCISSGLAARHRNLLAHALKTGRGANAITEHLLALCAANKASCRETNPGKLHLYMGPGRVKKRDLETAAAALRDLVVAARLTRDSLGDRDAAQMLDWMVLAWKHHAALLEKDIVLVLETAQDAGAGYAFSRIVALNTMATRPRQAIVTSTTSTGNISTSTTATSVGAGMSPRGARERDLGEVAASWDAMDPQVRKICVTLETTQDADLRASASVIEEGIKEALSLQTLAQQLAVQPFVGIQTMQQKCAVLKLSVSGDALNGFQAALDAAHQMQSTANDELRDLLLKKSIGKTQVKRLAQRVYASAMTRGPADSVGGHASRDELKTLHRHLEKVILHLSNAGSSRTPSSADSVEMLALKFVCARFKAALDTGQ